MLRSFDDFESAKECLAVNRSRWLVTGAAGFIGSHLVERLLSLNQDVVGLDNFSTGKRENIDLVLTEAGENAKNFSFVEGDITNYQACYDACGGVDKILHQAALGSVPRSMTDPIATFKNNAEGQYVLLTAAKDSGVKRFVYASSSSVYGDDRDLPKIESKFGKPLSPYALSKKINEEAAELFGRVFGMQCIGLRYFNVFGERQDPYGPYAAVIPRWFSLLSEGQRPTIFGDGQTSRDFCYVENVVRANILAALTESAAATGEVYNIACGDTTSLNELFAHVKELVAPDSDIEPIYEDFRPGDIAHSLASIDKARALLAYQPKVRIAEGLARAAKWYTKNH